MDRISPRLKDSFSITPLDLLDDLPNFLALLRSKSMGNSATTPRDMTCDSDVELMLLLLAESVAAPMRELASRCTVVEVCVWDVELNFFCRQRKLETPTCSSDEIARTAYELFRRNYRRVRPLRSIGVRGAGLVEATAGTQLSFYPEDAHRDKWERIDRAVDRLRQRYGYRSIQRARLLADPLLGAINPKDDHTVHPVGYFGG